MSLSAEQRQVALEELRSIVDSPQFCHSRRYPAFLSYIVETALRNQQDLIKERSIGVEVFGRPPDYDTGSDPLVRNAAGEVRKRLQLYYSSPHAERGLEIRLRAGSYVPEFHFSPPAEAGGPRPDLAMAEPVTPIAESAIQTPSSQSPKRPLLTRSLGFVLLGAVFALGILFFVLGYRPRTSEHIAVERFWKGFLNQAHPVVICIPEAPPPSVAKAALANWLRDNPDVAVEDVSALMQVVRILSEHNVPNQIEVAKQATLDDLKERPVILIGGPSNAWTSRILAPLRYHFRQGRSFYIEDARNPDVEKWIYDASGPGNSVVADCAIVARLFDSTTGDVVLVMAGAGRNGTEAAGDFVSSGRLLEDLDRQLPAGWENKNVEVVLKTKVIDRNTGMPSIEAVYSW
jgi:hypothetical protein